MDWMSCAILIAVLQSNISINLIPMRGYLQMHIIDEATKVNSPFSINSIKLSIYVSDYDTSVTLSKMSIVADIAR